MMEAQATAYSAGSAHAHPAWVYLARDVLLPSGLGRWLLLLWLVAGVGGCGYSMDTPSLPEGHRTFAVAAIQNQTYTAEVDVRLQRALRHRLLRIAGLRLARATDTDLLLQVTINTATASRSRGVNDTSVGNLSYYLSGRMTLLEQSSGRRLVDEKLISGASRLDFAEPTVETPAVRSEGLDDAIAVLADQIVQELLVDF